MHKIFGRGQKAQQIGDDLLWRFDEELVGDLLRLVEGNGQRLGLCLAAKLLRRAPIRHPRIERIENDVAPPWVIKLRQKVARRVVNDGRLVPFFDLIEGMEMDIEKNRYETFDDLYKYCYCAASSVGLMSIEIFGYKNEGIKKYAEYLGVALQLTNILRDIKKDALNNRIYLPLEDLKKFNYSESYLLNSVYNDNFKELMEYEYKRAKEYYEMADSFLKKEDKGFMVAARIMEHIYSELLKKIKTIDYNVFANTVSVPKYKKLILAYLIFIKYKLLYNTN